MRTGAKLQIKPGMSVAVIGAPDLDLELDGATITPDTGADAVIVFVQSTSKFAVADPAVQAASEDRLAWVAYPKAGQLGTDLNRDSLAELMRAKGVRPVRQISLDPVWSALRFRPGTPD